MTRPQPCWMVRNTIPTLSSTKEPSLKVMHTVAVWVMLPWHSAATCMAPPMSLCWAVRSRRMSMPADVLVVWTTSSVQTTSQTQAMLSLPVPTSMCRAVRLVTSMAVAIWDMWGTMKATSRQPLPMTVRRRPTWSSVRWAPTPLPVALRPSRVTSMAVVRVAQSTAPLISR